MDAGVSFCLIVQLLLLQTMLHLGAAIRSGELLLAVSYFGSRASLV